MVHTDWDLKDPSSVTFDPNPQSPQNTVGMCGGECGGGGLPAVPADVSAPEAARDAHQPLDPAVLPGAEGAFGGPDGDRRHGLPQPAPGGGVAVDLRALEDGHPPEL